MASGRVDERPRAEETGSKKKGSKVLRLVQAGPRNGGGGQIVHSGAIKFVSFNCRTRFPAHDDDYSSYDGFSTTQRTAKWPTGAN